MRRLVALIALLLCSTPAVAQSPAWSGSYTPGHAVMQIAQGVIGDAGGSAGSSSFGSKYLTELGITATGTPFCINDALISGAYHQFCLGANVSGAGALISYNAYNGASALPLKMNINGTTYDFPFTIGGIVGPPSSTVGDPACWNNTTGSLLADCALASAPQGRITLTSGTAIPTATVTAQTRVYYTPAVGQLVPIWNGTKFVMTDTGGQIYQDTTDATKSPSAAGNNACYDVFVWSDSGTIRDTRGPAWSVGGGSCTTGRGTGAGSTALTTVSGFLVNAQDISNGPAAGYGTYVGTIHTNGTATVDFNFGTSATGGGVAVFGVWNAYNQAPFVATVSDSTAVAWTYSSATPRALNNSTNNSVSTIQGLATQPFQASLQGATATTADAGSFQSIGLALDSSVTMDFAGLSVAPTAASFGTSQTVTGEWGPAIGYHTIYATEASDGTHANAFNGVFDTYHHEHLTVRVWQ